MVVRLAHRRRDRFHFWFGALPVQHRIGIPRSINECGAEQPQLFRYFSVALVNVPPGVQNTVTGIGAARRSHRIPVVGIVRDCFYVRRPLPQNRDELATEAPDNVLNVIVTGPVERNPVADGLKVRVAIRLKHRRKILDTPPQKPVPAAVPIYLQLLRLHFRVDLIFDELLNMRLEGVEKLFRRRRCFGFL